MNTPQLAPSALKISDVSIRQDEFGRFCLNDLHKAAGNNQKHKPANFLRIEFTKEMCTEIDSFSDMRSFEIIQGKSTYAVKELVYAYAMWISATFSLKVIRAYDALVSGSSPVSPSPATQSITLNLVQSHETRQRFLVDCAGGCVFITPIRPDEYVITAENIEQNLHEIFPGRALVNRTVLNNLVDAVDKIKPTKRM